MVKGPTRPHTLTMGFRDVAQFFRRPAVAAFVATCATGCAVEVTVVDDDLAPANEVLPAEDPCRVHTTRRDCCDNGCRVWFDRESSPWTLVCVSEPFDCSLHPDICGTGTVCDVQGGSGNGHCDYGYSEDSVGLCVQPGG